MDLNGTRRPSLAGLAALAAVSPGFFIGSFRSEASMMRIASKSVIGLVSSNGFERNKATLLGGPCGTRRGIPGILHRVLQIGSQHDADSVKVSNRAGKFKWI